MRQNRILAALLGGLFAAAPGCSSRGEPVPVVVTLDGKPVDGATVTLHLEGGEGTPASGYTAVDGTALITTPGGKGVPPGYYKVVVSKRAPDTSPDVAAEDPKEVMIKVGKEAMAKGSKGARLIKTKPELPEFYENPKKTNLYLKVPPDTTPFPLELKSKL
jgi:hypothetical protein